MCVSSLSSLQSCTQRAKRPPESPPANDAVSSTEQLLTGGHFSKGTASYDAAALAQQLAQLRTGDIASVDAAPEDDSSEAVPGTRWRHLKGDKYFTIPNNRIDLRAELPATRPFLDGVLALCTKMHRQRLHYYPPDSSVSKHPDGRNPGSHRLVWTLLSSDSAPGTKRFVIGLCEPVPADKKKRFAKWQQKVRSS